MLFNNRTREWDAASVSKELRSNAHSAENQLNQLTAKGFFTSNDSKKYQYKPASKELDEKVEKLFHIYQQMPVAVVTCIYEKPTDKLKDFSDAFKFKKD